MIVSIFNTKGGSGKTSTTMLLLSAIADSNTGDDAPLHTIAIDTDPQGTLSTFFERRHRTGLPAYGIEHRVVNLGTKTKSLSNETAQTFLRKEEQSCDLLVMDCAGSYDPDAAAAILVSHLVIVPTAMVMAEMDIALPIVRRLNGTAAAGPLDLRAFLSINRDEPIPSKGQKALAQIIEEEEIPRLGTRIPRLGVIAEMVNTGLFLHEMQGKGSSEKSIARSLVTGRRLLSELSDQTFPHQETTAP